MALTTVATPLTCEYNSHKNKSTPILFDGLFFFPPPPLSLSLTCGYCFTSTLLHPDGTTLVESIGGQESGEEEEGGESAMKEPFSNFQLHFFF